MIGRRAGVLRERNFRRFFVGYATSLLGTSMSAVAVAFAVLDSGGTAAGLGYVFAAGIVPQVIFMLGGGVIADRFGRRRAMLAADAVRCCAQAALAAALFLGHPRIWVFVLLAGLVGTGDAFFGPALSGLTVEIASSGQRANANALLSVANSAARVAGPALAGILVAVAGPAVVIACDAASYGASVFALGLLRLPGAARRSGRSPLADLAEGWAEFRSRAWLVITTVQFTLFNLLTWGPFLVLGPVVSKAYLGGAGGWGAVMAALGGGSILGGLLALGRRPRRPVAAATASTFGYAVPGALLALHAPVAAVAAGALVAGLGSGLGQAFDATAIQQQVPAGALSRVSAFETVTAFAFGPLAFAAAGPVAAVVGPGTVLGFGAAWSALSSAVALALPAIWAVTWRERAEPASAAGAPVSPPTADAQAHHDRGALPARGTTPGPPGIAPPP
ncbi:MAG TPA: MFS transporter [Streptosporangiaceae bacterium]